MSVVVTVGPEKRRELDQWPGPIHADTNWLPLRRYFFGGGGGGGGGGGTGFSGAASRVFQ